MGKKKAGPSRVDRNGEKLGVGDKIRVTGVPPGLKDEEDMLTKTIFEKCVGGVFTVRGFQDQLIELRVGRVVRRKSWEEAIWIEPKFVERVWSKSEAKAERGTKLPGRGRVLK